MHILSDISLPPGVQMRLHDRGISPVQPVSDDIAERIRMLWRQRNTCQEDQIDAIDASMERLVASGREDASLLPIDIGFDPRDHDMAVSLNPAWTHVRYQTAPGDEHTATGSYHDIVRELATAGGFRVIADHTPNGREIGYSAKRGKYTVQPHNDNYLLYVDTLDDAHAAYADPCAYW